MSFPKMSALLMFAFLSLTAHATSFFQRPFPDTVADAPIIVRGTTGAGIANWSQAEDGSRRIYTFYDLQVADVMKGNVEGRSIQIRQLGGEKDGLGLQVAGAAHFDRGDDVVVFLGDRNSDGSYDVEGMMMGKLDVERDDQGREVLVGAVLSPTVHADHEGEAQGGPGVWTVESLKKLIREQADAKLQSKQEVTSASAGITQSAETRGVAAPQLQPPPAEGEATPGGPGLSLPVQIALGGAVGVALLALVGWLRARRS